MITDVGKVRIKRIPWGSAEGINDHDRDVIRYHFNNHIKALKQFYGCEINSYSDWDNAKRAVRLVAWNDVKAADRNAAKAAVFLAAWNADRNTGYLTRVQSIAWNTAWDMGLDVASYASWQIIKDMPGYENDPSSHLINIYEMGVLIGNYDDKPTILTKNGWDIVLL